MPTVILEDAGPTEESRPSTETTEAEGASRTVLHSRDERGAFRILRRALRRIESAAARAGLAPDEVESFSLAVWEALVNAVRHGLRGRPDGVVHVRYGGTRGRAWVRVRDDGEGFDPSAVPDPTDPAHRLDDSGRGLCLMRALCESVEWSEGGRAVVLAKHAAAGGTEEPSTQPAP